MCRNIPIKFSLGSRVPEDFKVCSDISCSIRANNSRFNLSFCSGDDGIQLSEADGQYQISVPLSPGNCTISSAVMNSADEVLSGIILRRFRVSEEQGECPGESGIACLHGECSGNGPDASCVCDPGYGGNFCSETESPSSRWLAASADDASGSSLRSAYLELVKAALVDRLYEKDRAGETKVVARSMVGRPGLDELQALVEAVLQDGVPGDLMETGVWQARADPVTCRRRDVRVPCGAAARALRPPTVLTRPGHADAGLGAAGGELHPDARHPQGARRRPQKGAHPARRPPNRTVTCEHTETPVRRACARSLAGIRAAGARRLRPGCDLVRIRARTRADGERSQRLARPEPARCRARPAQSRASWRRRRRGGA